MNDLFAPILWIDTYTVRNGWGEIITRNALWVRRNGPHSAIFIINGRPEWTVPDSLWRKNV